MFEKKTEIKIQKGELWKEVIYFTRFTHGIFGGNIMPVLCCGRTSLIVLVIIEGVGSHLCVAL